MVRQSILWAVGMVVAMLVSGCSVIYKPVGGTLNAYAEDVAVADFLTYRDVDLLCHSGGSLLPLIKSFSRVGTRTEKTTSTLFLLAGFCEEQTAHEYHLRELMADRGGDYQAALNYAALKKRSLAQAARRQYESYQLAGEAYPLNGGQRCPVLASEQDELLFLLGNMQGLEAMLNDGKSGQLANVPRNIANDIYRSMDCLKNYQWWGVPQAVQASLLGFLPNLDREKAARSTELLEVAIKMGWENRVPLAETVAMAAWEGQGDRERLQWLIENHFAKARKASYDERWLSVSHISNRHLENMSDVIRLETEKTLTANPAEGYLIQDEPDIELDLDDI
ncbi:MAG: hypothetical protein R3208_04095 [Ketobacteraceae bacterium]|nr:hypothetical protein [Ketobacteraceae bacterium]